MKTFLWKCIPPKSSPGSSPLRVVALLSDHEGDASSNRGVDRCPSRWRTSMLNCELAVSLITVAEGAARSTVLKVTQVEASPGFVAWPDLKANTCAHETNTTQRHWWEALSTQQDEALFWVRPSVPRKDGREQCRHLECGRTQKQFPVVAWPSHFINAWRDISRKLPEVTGHRSSRAEPIEETEKKKHARHPAQTPASGVSKNPSGNKRQERKDGVLGLQDRRHRADDVWARQQKRAPQQRKTECVAQQRESPGGRHLAFFWTWSHVRGVAGCARKHQHQEGRHHLAIFATLPPPSVLVTRT